MKPKDFVLWVNAYNDRIIEQHEIARRLAYFSLAPHLDKPMTVEKFNENYWPLPADGEAKKLRIQRLKEKLKRANGSGTNENRDSGAGSASDLGS